MASRHCSPAWIAALAAAALSTVAPKAGAVASAELYQNQSYTYGRFEARVRFAAGDGVISSFFLWKPGSEMAGTFWNELDFEKLGADCRLQTNPLYGLPVVDHSRLETVEGDLCGEYHTYTFEWTPSYIAYLVDGVEVRRDGEDVAAAFNENAAGGMQIHFNVWPGDATFGGNFDPAILPIQQYISWVQYSSFADGEFAFQWREEFDGPTVPSGWAVGTWPSPKALSTHQPANVTFSAGLAVLSLTADDALGFTGAPPADATVEPPGAGGSTGSGGSSAGGSSAAGAGSPAGGGPGGSIGSSDGNSGASAPAGAAGSGIAGSGIAGEGGAGALSSAQNSRATDGGCQLVTLHAPSAGMWWLALGWATLLVRRRGVWLERVRNGAVRARRGG